MLNGTNISERKDDSSTGCNLASTSSSTSNFPELTVPEEDKNKAVSSKEMSDQTKLSKAVSVKKAFRCLPNCLSSRQIGSMKSDTFTSHLMKSRLGSIKMFRKLMPVSAGSRIYQTVYRANNTEKVWKCALSYGSYYVGAWFSGVDMKISILEKSYKKIEFLPPHISTINTQTIARSINNGPVYIVYPVHINDVDYSLIATSSDMNNFNHLQLVSCEFNESPIFIDVIPTIYGIAWDDNRKIIALGTEDGLFTIQYPTFHDFTNHMLDFPFSVHTAVEFSGDGNTLFTVGPCGRLINYDLRTGKIQEIVNMGKRIEYMKVLRNDYTLIISGHDNTLSNVDTRMNRVMCTYDGFTNEKSRIPFTFDENWNILCSSGDDNVTHLWDLKNGNQYTSIERPPNSVNQLYAVLANINNIIYITLFYDNKIHTFSSL